MKPGHGLSSPLVEAGVRLAPGWLVCFKVKWLFDNIFIPRASSHCLYRCLIHDPALLCQPRPRPDNPVIHL
jgi:hypothetical protein